MNLRIDGKWGRVVEVTGDRAAVRYELRLPLSKGEHRFRRRSPTTSPSRRRLHFRGDTRQGPKPKRGNRDQTRVARELVFQRFELEGPFNDRSGRIVAGKRRESEADSRLHAGCRRVGLRVCDPNSDAVRDRAFRRPLDPDEIKPYVDLTVDAAKSDPFDRAIHTGLTAILVSPQFLFRIESRDVPARESDPVADRSFRAGVAALVFPLEQHAGRRVVPTGLQWLVAQTATCSRPQVRRMLRDEKSRALVDNFADPMAQSDAARHGPTQPAASFETLRQRIAGLDMRRETELFFESIVHEDRSILELLNGKVHVLERATGQTLRDTGDRRGRSSDSCRSKGYPRAGVLTQASILTLTSQPTRTSPVKRGKWILETFLGSAPPPPPPNVPELAATMKANPKASLREQLAIHRQSSKCSVCHKVMDPLGFGLENFDGIGRWREKEKDRPVDASGTLPGGESFRGPIELVGVLSKRQDVFRRHLARTLLTYALGRGLEYYDACAVDRIVEATRRARRPVFRIGQRNCSQRAVLEAAWSWSSQWIMKTSASEARTKRDTI